MAAAKDLAYNLTGHDVSASKTMAGFAENAEHATGRIGGAFGKVGNIIGGEFGEILNKAGEGIEKLGESTNKWSGAMQVGGGIATGLGMAMTAMGAADKQASDQLKQSVENSGHTWEDYKGSVEETVGAQEKFGHSAVDTQGALQKLTQATNDPLKAIDLMGVTADLAAARHISLSEASTLVSKVVNGSGSRTLKEYGIVMAATGDKTKNAKEALDLLSGKLSGQAAASMDNFNGFVRAAGASLEDWGAKIGQVAGPVLTVLGPAMMVFGTVLDMVKTKQAASAAASTAAAAAAAAQAVATDLAAVSSGGLAVSSDALAASVVVESVATDVATTSTLALAAAWLLTPVGLITAGLTAVVAVIAAVVMSTQEATLATVDYSASLAADNGVVGEHVRLQASKALADAGAIDAAQKLGLSTSLMTQAAMGNEDAIKKVTEVTGQATDALKNSDPPQRGATKAAREHYAALKDLAEAGKKVKESVDQQAGSVRGSSDTLNNESNAMGTVAGSAGALAQGLGKTVDQYAALKSAQDGATQASKDFKAELDILNGGALSLDSAQVAVQSTSQSMATAVANAVKSGSDAATKAAALSMDTSTAAGVVNHNNVKAMMQANSDLGAAMITNGDGSTKSQNAANDAMRAGEEDIKKAAIAAGLNGDAVDAMFAKYGKIPANINTIVTVDTSQAVKSFQDLFRVAPPSMQGDGSMLRIDAANHATGGTVMGGGSGISDSVPIMASAGEEVIGATNAARWRPLLKDINAGRTPTLPSSGGGGGITIGTFIAQANQSAAEIASELGWIGRWAT